MRLQLPPLRLTGARALRRGRLQQRTVAIENGRIAGGPFPAVELDGYLILPGIIDLHGTSLDRGPSRPLASTSLLQRADRMAAASGVTTGWVSVGWCGAGGPDLALRFLDCWARYRSAALTDLRMKVRYEMHSPTSAQSLADAVHSYRIDQVALGSRIARSIAPDDMIPKDLAGLAEAFDAAGICYGSLTEDDAAAREAMSRLGARLCEFPAQAEPALVARATGHPVLRRASEMVARTDGAFETFPCDAIASEGNHPALSHAAFSLVDRGMMSLSDAWSLISERPAEIMGFPDRGRIEQRMRADLAILCERTGRVEATIRGGVLIHAQGEAHERFRLAGVMAPAIAAE